MPDVEDDEFLVLKAKQDSKRAILLGIRRYDDVPRVSGSLRIRGCKRGLPALWRVLAVDALGRARVVGTLWGAQTLPFLLPLAPLLRSGYMHLLLRR